MALPIHSNDNAREGRPGLWIFQGRSVVLLVVGVAAFVGLFRTFDSTGLDLPINAVISLVPLLVMGAFVQFFVNGKPASYAFDSLLFLIWSHLKDRRGTASRETDIEHSSENILPDMYRCILAVAFPIG